LAAALRRRRESGGKIWDLTESNPTLCGFAYPEKELLGPLADRGNLRYEPDPRGLPSARRAVAGYYAQKGIAVDAERIFLTAGTSEAYSFILKLLCDPGDRISVPRPGYPLLDHLAALNDVEAVRHDFARTNRGWRLDERSLGESVKGFSPKAVLAVNPNNPIGHFYSGAERRFIADRLKESGGAVIADEVFLDYGRGGESFAATSPVLTFTLGGLSKMLGLPQMKLAWIAVSGPEREVKEACGRLEVIADAYLSVNTPSQRSLEAWMKLRPQLQAAISARLERNRAFLLGAARGSAVEALGGEGGWHAVMRIDSREDDEALAVGLIEKEGVVTQPGYFFDFEGGAYLVVCLLSEPSVFEEGIRRLLRAAAP